jgi:hypothetical protein
MMFPAVVSWCMMPTCHPACPATTPGGHTTRAVTRAVRSYLQHEWERKRLEGEAAAAKATASARAAEAAEAAGAAESGEGRAADRPSGSSQEPTPAPAPQGDGGAADRAEGGTGGVKAVVAGGGGGGGNVPYEWSLRHPELVPVQLSPDVLPDKRVETLPRQVSTGPTRARACWRRRRRRAQGKGPALLCDSLSGHVRRRRFKHSTLSIPTPPHRSPPTPANLSLEHSHAIDIHISIFCTRQSAFLYHTSSPGLAPQAPPAHPPNVSCSDACTLPPPPALSPIKQTHTHTRTHTQHMYTQTHTPGQLL